MRPRPVVTVRPYSLVAAVFGTLFLIGFTCGLATGVVAFLRSVDLVCDRGEGVCAIDSSWGPSHTRETFPIASVHALRIDATKVRAKRNTTNYDGVLVTDQGERQVSNVSTSDPTARRAAAKRFNAFLADPSERTIDVPYDGAQLFPACFLTMWCVVMLVLDWHLLRFARVWVDAERGTLHVREYRLPLPSRETTFPVSALTEVRVATSQTAKNGKTYAVELCFEGRPSFVVVDLYSSGSEDKEIAVMRIEDLTGLRSRPAPAA